MEALKLERLRKYGAKSEQSDPNQLQFDQLLVQNAAGELVADGRFILPIMVIVEP